MNLKEALEALPATADEIAAKFREEGLRGRKTRPVDCPLAKYLAPTYPHNVVSVGVCYATVYTGGGSWEAIDRAELPPAARNFIHRFDIGEYPDIVEGDS